MNLWEVGKLLGIDVATCLEERFMGNEALYVRFLKKLLDDKNLQQLVEAVQNKNYQEVERKAHTLKGVCATLGLTDVSMLLGKMVSMVRNGAVDEATLNGDLEQVSQKMQQALMLIEKL